MPPSHSKVRFCLDWWVTLLCEEVMVTCNNAKRVSAPTVLNRIADALTDGLHGEAMWLVITSVM